MKKIYNFIDFVNENIFEPLNGNVRIDAYIGIVGILVAIVIFVAETMNDKKVETQKRFVLEKTKMKCIMTFSIIILSFCILKELIPYNMECTNIVKIIFFFVELLLNISIFCSICLTIKLFCGVIKLNTNSDYFFNNYDKYIKERLKKIHKKNIYYSGKKLKNESINKFVKENNKYFSFELDNKNDYIAIKANKSGIFKSYSCRCLQAIIDKIEEKDRKREEIIIYSKPVILLTLNGGEKINRSVTVAYIKKEFINYEESIRSSLLLNDSIPYQDNEINLIIKDLYFLSEQDMDDNFDSNNRLFNYYNFFYQNNMSSLLDISFDYIRKIYIKCYKNIYKNRELANFLSLLSNLAYINEDDVRYKFLCNYIYYCYREQLNLTNDVRKISYDYTNSLFKYDYYSIKENSDSIYYDILLSNLMNFLFDLINKKAFQAINDIFNNVIFDYNGFIDGEPDSYDIVKIQFSFGFVYGLIILSNKNIFNENDKDNLIKLINHIKNNFVDIYSQNEAIEYFLKFYNLNSNVHDVYYDFDFRFTNKEYRNSWSGTYVDDIFVLKEFISIFDVHFSNIKDLKPSLISKDYKYFYNRLLDLTKSGKVSKLDAILNISINNDSLIELLEALISECANAEKKFIKNNKLNIEKINIFKSTIFEKIESGNELILYLKGDNKYSIKDKKCKRLFGFNQIIGRELFFDNVSGIDNISKNYGQAILTGITKDYLKKLDSISNVNKEDIIKYIDHLNKKEKYVIITSPSNLRNLKLNNFNDKVIDINGRNLDLIKIPNARDIYLIKKKDLPKIEMLEPDIKDSGLLKNGVYCNLIDCSTNAKIRIKIQKNSKWLNEKGTVQEQIEYLKGKCILKLFISPVIRKIPKSECYKFVIKEEE